MIFQRIRYILLDFNNSIYFLDKPYNLNRILQESSKTLLKDKCYLYIFFILFFTFYICVKNFLFEKRTKIDQISIKSSLLNRERMSRTIRHSQACSKSKYYRSITWHQTRIDIDCLNLRVLNRKACD